MTTVSPLLAEGSDFSRSSLSAPVSAAVFDRPRLPLLIDALSLLACAFGFTFQCQPGTRGCKASYFSLATDATSHGINRSQSAAPFGAAAPFPFSGDPSPLHPSGLVLLVREVGDARLTCLNRPDQEITRPMIWRRNPKKRSPNPTAPILRSLWNASIRTGSGTWSSELPGTKVPSRVARFLINFSDLKRTVRRIADASTASDSPRTLIQSPRDSMATPYVTLGRLKNPLRSQPAPPLDGDAAYDVRSLTSDRLPERRLP